jgi:uncharacterized protein YehS (DUF1456 family)
MALQFDIPQIKTIFAAVEIELSDKEINNLLKTEYEPQFEALPDYVLVLFLNGLIDTYRGKKEGVELEPVAKTIKISSNDVLKKLRIAFNLQEQEVRDALKLVTIELTKSDLAALFRKAGHAQYKACDDELLLDFIEGLGLLLKQRQES